MCLIFADDGIIVFKSNKNNSKSQLKPDLAKVKNWTFQLNIFEA